MKVIANELENDFIEICRAIHNYSFDIFAHRVTKREHKLSDIRGYLELDQTHCPSIVPRCWHSLTMWTRSL